MRVIVLDNTILSDSNFRKNEHKRLKNITRAEKGAGKDTRSKDNCVVSGDRSCVPKTVTPKLGDWLEKISGTSEIFVPKSAILGAVKILRRTLRLPLVDLSCSVSFLASKTNQVAYFKFMSI